MAFAGQGRVHGSDPIGHCTTGRQIRAECSGLFCVGELLVEQEIDDVLHVHGREFSDGVSAVVHALGGGHEGGPAGAHGDAAEPRVEVSRGDRQEGFVVGHRCTG